MTGHLYDYEALARYRRETLLAEVAQHAALVQQTTPTTRLTKSLAGRAQRALSTLRARFVSVSARERDSVSARTA